MTESSVSAVSWMESQPAKRPTPPLDWNVVVTTYEGEYTEAIRLLAPFGDVSSTDYWNVLVMAVADIPAFIDQLEDTLRDDASIANSVSRIVPLTRRFRFQSPDEFEAEACRVLDEWLPKIRGKSFHVRMHRRGFKGRLSSQHEEQFLDHHLMQSAGSAGARIDFEDPDVIVAVETVGQDAGLSIWTREQLAVFDLARLD
jgi:tRNA(Ser,Leu) C12 N-acetylase TAN1